MPPSPFHQLQQSQGALFPPAGFPALHFGNPGAEDRAARESAALIDLSGWSQIAVAGADCRSFLHSFCTNDINALSPGTGCEAFLTDIKGRILGHFLVAAGEDELRLVSVPAAASGIIAHLDRYLITEDAELRDLTSETTALCLTGPRATAGLRDALDADVSNLAMYAEIRAGKNPVVIRRVPFALQPAFLLSASADSIADLWQRLSDADATPAGSDVWNALRIEAGFPLYGVDISGENIAQEAGRTKQAISFTKGCYLGQEPIARLDALGHVNRLLCRLRLSPVEPIPARGTTLLDEAGEQEIGSITSAAIDYSSGEVVALAMLKAACAAEDSPVSIRSADDVLVTGRVTGESGAVSG